MTKSIKQDKQNDPFAAAIAILLGVQDRGQREKTLARVIAALYHTEQIGFGRVMELAMGMTDFYAIAPSPRRY